MANKCAVVLVVKNEASDILSWLAWHHTIGFDAFIIFDDNSTDGTWNILERAKGAQDIRLFKTKGPADQRYQLRQIESYKYALAEFKTAFDWLAFLDADEFLALQTDDSVAAFLARFEAADAVAVNWCNYGSAGHVLKPPLLPTEAYTWHAKPGQPINRHVKSFVRPAKVGPRWRSVHGFDVAEDRYVLANGQKVVWSETFGIIDGDPDWSIAKIMHYQCRSMEHFIERMKKRPNLAIIPGIWSAYDFHNVEDRSPARHTDAVKQQVERLEGKYRQVTPAPVFAAPRGAGKLVFDIGMSEGNDTAFYLAKGCRVVGVEADAKAYYFVCERFKEHIASGQMKVYNFAAAQTTGAIIQFFHHDQHQGISGLSSARAEFKPGNHTSYYVSTINWPTLVAENGVPYYLKIDIEGQETSFLDGMSDTDALPEYVSVECHALAPVKRLWALGYRRFRLIDQNPPGGFKLPEPQVEGATIDWPEFRHSSGPFGLDLPDGRWLDSAEFESAWQAAQPAYARTWFDCHAWRP